MAAESGDVKCCSCSTIVPAAKSQKVAKENAAAGKGDRYRCNTCHSVLSRLHRLRKGNEGLPIFDEELTGQARADFISKAATMYGADLQRHLVETVTHSRLQRRTSAFNTGGDYTPIDEVMTAYANKPDQLKSILAKAPRLHCEVRGVDMIQVPTYSRAEKTRRSPSKRTSGGSTARRPSKSRKPQRRPKQRRPRTPRSPQRRRTPA